MIEWNDASEWTPDDSRVCLVCDAINRIISLGVHCGDNEWELMTVHEMTCDVCITHWADLPEIPEKEEE
jgi:hypothetical protein